MAAVVMPSFIATVERVVSVTDGDTVRLDYSYWREQRPGMAVEVHESDPVGKDEGIPCRLVLLDTPERKDRAAWAKARLDALTWIGDHLDAGLEMEVWLDGRGGFGRPLVDIYVRGARDVTLSQHMLRLGWFPYIEE